MPSRASQRASTFGALAAITFTVVATSRSARADEPPAAPPPAEKPAGPADPAEGKPARPPPLPETEPRPLPWDRLLDVGGDLAIVARPASGDAGGHPSSVRYAPATGFALHVRWPLHRYLQIEGYFVDCHLPVNIPRGALGTDDTITSPPVETFVFGVRVSPKITWGRVTGSVSAGVGWGRFEFQRMLATTSSGATYTLRERGASLVEFPLGIGFSWEIVPRWLSFDLRGTAAIVVEQHGEAFEHAQTVSSSGRLQNVGPLPIIDASLVQTIGFSLLL